MSFTTGTDALSGVTRTFTSFSAAVRDAAESRLYGGIHCRSANEDGLTMGIEIGEWTVSRVMRPSGIGRGSRRHRTRIDVCDDSRVLGAVDRRTVSGRAACGAVHRSTIQIMAVKSSGRVVDRTAFRAVDWEDHVGDHDARLREYWLRQPVAVRLAGAMRCRWRVHGQLPPVDRTSFRLVDLGDLND